MAGWLCGYVAMWLDQRGSKSFALKEVHRLGYEQATVPDYEEILLASWPTIGVPIGACVWLILRESRKNQHIVYEKDKVWGVGLGPSLIGFGFNMGLNMRSYCCQNGPKMEPL